VLIIRFASHMITENVQVFWAELQRGEFITDAAVAAGTYRKQGSRWGSPMAVSVLVVGAT
jgi:hypothetical protein